MVSSDWRRLESVRGGDQAGWCLSSSRVVRKGGKAKNGGKMRSKSVTLQLRKERHLHIIHKKKAKPPSHLHSLEANSDEGEHSLERKVSTAMISGWPALVLQHDFVETILEYQSTHERGVIGRNVGEEWLISSIQSLISPSDL